MVSHDHMFAKFQTNENLCMISSFLYDWQVWCARIRDAQNAKRVEPYRQVHVYESDKTFYNTLWFCILKSLKSIKNVPKSPQITPDVPKSMHLGHIFLLGRQTMFLHCPTRMKVLAIKNPYVQGDKTCCTVECWRVHMLKKNRLYASLVSTLKFQVRGNYLHLTMLSRIKDNWKGHHRTNSLQFT